MVYSWEDIKPGEPTLTVLSSIFGILLGSLVSLTFGVIVVTVYSSVILTILIAPVVGGMSAGCFSRGNLPLGAFNGVGVGTITAVAILGTAWTIATDTPVTGGAGLAIGILLLMAVVAAVTSVVLAVIGGLVGAGVSKMFENYRAEQSGEQSHD